LNKEAEKKEKEKEQEKKLKRDSKTFLKSPNFA
jgi:hypothetical protein